MLAVGVRKQLGEFSIDAQFAAEGGVTALFGTSGSGKTSIVNMIAGLLTPDSGRIALDGDVLFDSESGVDMPPHRRNIGYIFQEARLFPHMNARSNLEYGRRMRGLRRDALASRRIVDLLGIGHLLSRRVGALSGGERQRIAIGRALLMQPRLLLLDEPVASLDADRKAEIFPYLERLRDESHVPMIYVSHNPGEIVSIATKVVQIDAGRVRRIADTAEFFAAAKPALA
ncbi:MAG: molybdenum ABC transporter ATP-binding protein [Pseudorhodoplanes sp.]